MLEQERLQQIAEDKARFEDLKSQAEQVQQEKLSNIKTVEEYETVYGTLDPDVQQFFSTPDEVRQQKAERIEASKTTVQSQIQVAEARQQKLDIDYAKICIIMQKIMQKLCIFINIIGSIYTF